MRRLFSKISGRCGSSRLKRVLLLSLLFGVLVIFNRGFADGPEQEHPWDDLHGSDLDQTIVNPPTIQNWVVISTVVGPQVIVRVESTVSKENQTKGKVSEPSVKNRVHLFIFIK